MILELEHDRHDHGADLLALQLAVVPPRTA
jgi:hypothetical protein